MPKRLKNSNLSRTPPTRTPPTREPVTITFVYPPFGSGRAAYEKLAKSFQEESPYITVELIRRAPWQSGADEGHVIAVFGELIWSPREDDTKAQ